MINFYNRLKIQTGVYLIKETSKLIYNISLTTIDRYRSKDTHWRDYIVLSGTIASVIGFATSFFLGKRLTYLCFGTSALTLLFSGHYVHLFPKLKSLEKSAEDYKAENEKLSSSNLTLEKTIEVIRNQLLEFGAHNLTFGKNLQDNQKQFKTLFGEFTTSKEKMEDLVKITCQTASDKIALLTGTMKSEHTSVIERFDKKIKEHQELLKQEIILLEETKDIHKKILLEAKFAEETLKDNQAALKKAREDLHEILEQTQEATRNVLNATKAYKQQANSMLQSSPQQIPSTGMSLENNQKLIEVKA